MTQLIKVKVNDKELGKFKGSAKQLKDLKKPMSQFLSFLELETKIQFVGQKDPEGRRWADLKPKTWERKKSNSILRETGTMINTIYTRTKNLSGEIGLSSEYAIYHQFGTKKMPKREILGITPQRLAKGAAIFEAYVVGLVKS